MMIISDELTAQLMEYFDQRADAEYETSSASPIPNIEMKIYTALEEEARGQPKAQGVPEGQVMVPRGFLTEYYGLIDDSDFTTLHKLVRKNAIQALLSTTPQPDKPEEGECTACGGTGFRSAGRDKIGTWPCEFCRPTPPADKEIS